MKLVVNPVVCGIAGGVIFGISAADLIGLINPKPPVPWVISVITFIVGLTGCLWSAHRVDRDEQ